MKKSRRFVRISSGSVFAFLVATGVLFADPAPTRYRIEDLGTFGGPDGCENGVHQTWAAANGLNESGHVVGWAERSVQVLDPDNGEPLYYPDTGHAVCTLSFHGALWRDGEIIDLGTLVEGAHAQGNRVNDHDHVVGVSYGGSLYSGHRHPFLWTEEDGMIDLLPDDPMRRGTSWGINNFGEITIIANGAYFRDVNGDLRAIEFSDSASTAWDEAFEINDDGIVAGHALLGRWPQAFRYDSSADVVENIHDPFYLRSYAYGVNPQGDIAAKMTAPTGHGFSSVATSDGGLVVLPTGNIRRDGVLRSDLLWGEVDDVNALGDVIGTDRSPGGLPSVAWIAFDVLGDGPIEKIPLEELLSPEDQAEWDIHWAWEMNDARQLAGRGAHNGQNRAFLMTPDDTRSDGDAGTRAAATASSAGRPVGANRAVIDPVTGLAGVTNFVPDGMGPNREIGSLRPRPMIESREVGGRDLEGRLATERGDESSRILPRTPRLAPPDTSSGSTTEPVDRTPTREVTPRDTISRVASETRDRKDR